MDQKRPISFSTMPSISTSKSASQIDDPQTLVGLFPPDSDDDDDDEFDKDADTHEEINNPNCYEIQSIQFVGKTIRVRQFDYHSHNANRIWPGAFPLAEYLLQERPTAAQSIDNSSDNGKYLHQWGRILELGAATGLLAIRLAMASTAMYRSDNGNDDDNDATDHSQQCCCTSIVTSDVDDEYGDVAANLSYNYHLNHMALPFPYHVPHTWGTGFQQSVQNVIHKELADHEKCMTACTNHTSTPATNNGTDVGSTTTKSPTMMNSNHPLLVPFDTIIASDILLYVSSYPALVATLSELMIPKLVLTQDSTYSNDCNEGNDITDTTLSSSSPNQSSPLCTTATTTAAKITTTTTVPTQFIMSWNRRLKESQEFFVRMNDAGFVYEHHGKGIYTFVYDHQHPH